MTNDLAQPEPQPSASRSTGASADGFHAALESAVLGQEPYLTRADVIERAGTTLERAHALWLSLGFPTPADDSEVLFIDADVEALRALTELVDSGLVPERAEYALARSMGRSFARLAEWQIDDVAASAIFDDQTFAEDEIDQQGMAMLAELVDGTLHAVENLQNYVWRRHLASAVGRLMLTDRLGAQGSPSSENVTSMAVGFADIVGFTRRTRQLDSGELADLVETFEARVNEVIAEHGGRVIKTIGDEVLFAADDPVEAARIAVILAGAHAADEEFPELRVGAAYGPVLSRLGDVFGETVNIAARLTSVARRGRVLVDPGLAAELGELDEFRVRRVRAVAVKGYSRLEPWSIST